MKAPLPTNEAARLEALRHYHILDTAPETNFDDLTRLAAQICGTPVALVSLVDADRLWFKSKVGWDVSEMPRESGICAPAILASEVLVVPDALADERFATCSLVTTDPKIRFYAGAPGASAFCWRGRWWMSCSTTRPGTKLSSSSISDSGWPATPK